MIAHRLNILSNFDRVIELNRGKVIKEGKPKDILIFDCLKISKIKI